MLVMFVCDFFVQFSVASHWVWQFADIKQFFLAIIALVTLNLSKRKCERIKAVHKMLVKLVVELMCVCRKYKYKSSMHAWRSNLQLSKIKPLSRGVLQTYIQAPLGRV